MNIIDKLIKQPVYLKGEYGIYRTEPTQDGIKRYKKTPQGEVEINFTDNGYKSALAYDGIEITKQEYQES